MKYELTAAVLGAGRMGHRHIQMLHALGLEVVGVSDPHQESLEAIVRQEGIEQNRMFQDSAVLLRETRPEFVIVATTADAHSVLTCLAAEFGAKYVLCEKPMACSIAECDKMIDVCRSSGTRLAINHPMRYMPCYVEPKRIIESEEFGGLLSMTVVGGNFGMSMNGTHFFEGFRYLANEEPDEVTAWFDDEIVPNPRGPNFVDRGGSVRITTQSGKRFYMECGARQGHRITVVLAGPYGQLVVDQLTGSMFQTVRQGDHRALPSTRYGMPSLDQQTKLEDPDIVELCSSVATALIDGGDYPTGEDGLLAVRTLVASHASDEMNHRAIKLNAHALPDDRAFPWA